MRFESKKKLLKSILIYIALIIGTLNASAQLSLVANQSYSVNTSEFQNLSVQVRVNYNGNPVELKAEDFTIVEKGKSEISARMNYSTIPYEVSNLENGWQTIKWESSQYDFADVNPVTVIASYEKSLAGVNLAYALPSIPLLIVKNAENGLQEREIYLGRVKAGETGIHQIHALFLKGIFQGENELPVMLDSITFSSPYFSYEWFGHPISRKAPPVNMHPGFHYLLSIFFTPPDESYYRAIMTFHYHNGQKREIAIQGGIYNIDRKKSLELIYPKGGENFAPCQEIEIKWKGHIKSLTTVLEVSYDNGEKWDFIDEVFDSTYTWIVPEEITDEMKIRIYQRFAKTQEKLLQINSNPVYSIAFNESGSSLLSFNSDGVISEWEIAGFSEANRYSVNGENNPPKLVSGGIDYIENGSKFWAFYNHQEQSSIIDTLVLFEKGNSNPVLKNGLPPELNSSVMHTDPEGRFLLLISENGNSIHFLSPVDGSFIKTISYNSLVTSVSLVNSSIGSVSLLNGDLHIVSLPDFNTIQRFNYELIPIILETAVSWDGKYLSIGCMADGTGQLTDIHVIDINDGRIVRSIRVAATDPIALGFSSTSSLLVIGSLGQPQIAFMDLPANDYVGTISGNLGLLTDFAFSPDDNAIATSSTSGENLVYRAFTYPEADTTQGFIKIHKPVIEVNDATFEKTYLGIEKERIFVKEFCNIGDVIFDISNTYLWSGKHFKILNQLHPDTLYPGECKEIHIVYNPKDTGKLYDTLYFESCSAIFYLPLESVGLPRTISYFNEPGFIGEVCVGDTISREFLLLKNEDPVPLTIDRVVVENPFDSPFSLVTDISDTTLQPGQSISIKIRFAPEELGDLSGELLIYHSGQITHVAVFKVEGRGLGTFLELSHEFLAFIPEQQTRELIVRNAGQDPVTIFNINLQPEGICTILTQFPIKLQPGNEAKIEISWDLSGKEIVTAVFEAGPCAVNSEFELGPYIANSYISIPVVEADPRYKVEIPVNFTTNENYSYSGLRNFSAEFTIHAGLFLPLEIVSDYGTGTLTKNEIDGKDRTVGFTVNGDFPESGEVARIRGMAGLSDVITSLILINSESDFWGKAVNSSFSNGVFNLVENCGDLTVVRQGNTLSINSISPIPAGDIINIDSYSTVNDEIIIEIFNDLGNKVLVTNKFNVIPGSFELTLNISSLPTGTYRVVIRGINSIASQKIIIVR